MRGLSLLQIPPDSDLKSTCCTLQHYFDEKRHRVSDRMDSDIRHKFLHPQNTSLAGVHAQRYTSNCWQVKICCFMPCVGVVITVLAEKFSHLLLFLSIFVHRRQQWTSPIGVGLELYQEHLCIFTL